MSSAEVVLRFLIAAVVGYFLGSIPSGVIVGRIFGRVDPRTLGSGKTGATNVLRTAGRGPAALVVLLDVGKGVAAVLLARFLIFPVGPGAGTGAHNLQATAEAIAAFAALLGHNFSIFIHFTGGRGVATGAGAILAMSPLAIAVGVIAMIVPVAVTKYVSLGSILSAAICALAALGLAVTGHDYLPHAIFALIGGAFVIFSHRDNIERLLSGTERKLGQPAH